MLSFVALALLDTVRAADTEKTCNLWQVCENHKDLTPGEYPTTFCANGGDVAYPSFVPGGYAPQPMGALGVSNMQTVCPFFELENPGGNLCCNPDTASIMLTNFA